MAHVIRGDEAGRGPGSIRAGHSDRVDLGLVPDEGLWKLDPRNALVRLTDPVEAGGLGPAVAERPGSAGREIDVAARSQGIRLPVEDKARAAANDEQYALGFRIGLRPVAAAIGS